MRATLTRRILTELGATVIEARQRRGGAGARRDRPTPISSSATSAWRSRTAINCSGDCAPRAMAPDVLPAIALTAFARMEDRNEALAAGFPGTLVKPLDPQLLVSRVARLCRARSDR